MPERAVGEDLKAECWFCNDVFVKKVHHKECGFWICPYCRKCGCHLDPFTRQALEKTYRAFRGEVP